MEQIWTAFSTMTAELITIDRWPWVAVMAILTIFGQFASLKVFTRENAYKNWGSNWLGKLKHEFYFRGRESMMLHPIAAGMLVALNWPNPEGADPAWGFAATAAYFGSAGVASLFAWSYLKYRAKAKGYDLRLPGVPRPPKLEQ